MHDTSTVRKTEFREDGGHPAPFVPTRPGRGAANKIAPSLGEQLQRALTPRVFSDIDLSRREIARALKLLTRADRRLAAAGGA